MPDRFEVSGFDDSGPSKLPRTREDAAAPYVESNRAFDVRTQAELAEQHERQRIDAQVDRRLHALKAHVEGLYEAVDRVKTDVAGVRGDVSRLSHDMGNNTEMTEKILAAVSGGKMLVAVIKFIGALAVPISAIAALWYTFTHGGTPPH